MTEYNFKGTYEHGSLDEIVAGEILNKIEIIPEEYTSLKKIIKDVAPAVTGGLIASVFLYYMN